MRTAVFQMRNRCSEKPHRLTEAHVARVAEPGFEPKIRPQIPTQRPLWKI